MYCQIRVNSILFFIEFNSPHKQLICTFRRWWTHYEFDICEYESWYVCWSFITYEYNEFLPNMNVDWTKNKNSSNMNFGSFSAMNKHTSTKSNESMWWTYVYPSVARIEAAYRAFDVDSWELCYTDTIVFFYFLFFFLRRLQSITFGNEWLVDAVVTICRNVNPSERSLAQYIELENSIACIIFHPNPMMYHCHFSHKLMPMRLSMSECTRRKSNANTLPMK